MKQELLKIGFKENTNEEFELSSSKKSSINKTYTNKKNTILYINLDENKGNQIDPNDTLKNKTNTNTNTNKKYVSLQNKYSDVFIENYPWKIDDLKINVDTKETRLSYKEISLKLDYSHLCSNITSIIQQRYPHTNIEFSTSSSEGIWCLFEFNNSDYTIDYHHPIDPANNQKTVAGFRFFFTKTKSDISIITTDHFYLGDIPSLFLEESTAIIALAVGLRLNDNNLYSLYEYRFNLSSIMDSIFYLYLNEEKELKEYFLQASKNTQINIVSNKEQLILSSSLKEKISLKNIPIHVLESRENFSKNLLLDSSIILGKYNYKKELKDYSIYLLRRLTLSYNNCDNSKLDLIEKASETEPNFLTFKSYILNSYLHKKDNYEKVLDYLSEFTLYLSENINDFEYLSSFKYIIPKLLGDLWYYNDIDKSEKCYLKLLDPETNECSDINLLLILAEIKRKQNNTIKLKEYLNHILQLKPTKDIEGHIYKELMELSKDDEKTKLESIEHGLACLEICKDINIAFEIIDIMLEKSLVEESINLLNSFYEEEQEHLSKKDISNLKYKLAYIWLNKLNRKDMAKSQILDSLNCDKSNTKAIDLLVEIYKLDNNYSEVLTLLKDQLSILEHLYSSSDTDNNDLIQQIFKIKHDIYSIEYNVNKDKLSALKTYINIDKNNRFNYQELDKLIETSSVSNLELNWDEIHDILSSYLTPKESLNIEDLSLDKDLQEEDKDDEDNKNSTKNKNSKLDYIIHSNIILAKLCSNKLKNDYLAVKHFLNIKDLYAIDSNFLKYIGVVLINNKDYSNLLDLYKSQYYLDEKYLKYTKTILNHKETNTDDSSNKVLSSDYNYDKAIEPLREMIIEEISNHINQLIDFSEFIDLVTHYYKTYSHKESVLYTISENLLSINNLSKLESFIDHVLANIEDTDLILSLLNLNINSLIYLSYDNKDATLSFLLKRKYNYTNISQSDFQDILTYFKYDANKDSTSTKEYIKYFIILLLESNIEIPMNHADIVYVLSEDNRYLEIYYNHLVSLDDLNYNTILDCISYFKDREDYSKINILLKKPSCKDLPKDLLSDIENNITQSDNWELLIKINEQKLKESESFDSKTFDVLFKLVHLYKENTKDIDRISYLYNTLLDNYDLKNTEEFKEIINFSKEQSDDSLEKKILIKFITHPEFEEDLDNNKEYIFTLYNKYHETETVKAILNSIFTTYESNYRDTSSETAWNSLIKVAHLLKELGISNPNSLLILFIDKIQSQDSNSNDNLSDNLLEILNTITTSAQLSLIYTKIFNIFKDKESEEKHLCRLLLDILSNEKLTLNQDIINEFRILVCLSAFELLFKSEHSKSSNEEDNEKIFNQFLLAFETYDKNEKSERILLPLYHLYDKLKTKQETYQYLEQIYPILLDKSYLLENENISLNEIKHLISKNKISQLDPAINPDSDTNLDWKELILNNKIDENTPDIIYHKAFEKDLEKHLALQCITLILGDFSILSNWYLNVWRNHKNYTYSLNYKEHFPEDGIPQILYTRYYKLISILTPVFSFLYKEKLSLKGYATTHKLNYDELVESSSKIEWIDFELMNTGIHKFPIFSLFKSTTLMNTKLNGLDIIYDSRKSSFYLNLENFKLYPPTVLLHSLLFTMWSIKLKYYTFLYLDNTDILPIINYLKEYFNNSLIKKVKSLFKSQPSNMEFILDRLNKDDLQRIYSKIPSITEKEISYLKNACKTHIYRLQLADSLDLLGFMEYKTGMNLLDNKKLKTNEIFSLYPNTQNIIDYILKLEFK